MALASNNCICGQPWLVQCMEIFATYSLQGFHFLSNKYPSYNRQLKSWKTYHQLVSFCAVTIKIFILVKLKITQSLWVEHGHWWMYSISQEICTRFLLCCALLWLYIDWFLLTFQTPCFINVFFHFCWIMSRGEGGWVGGGGGGELGGATNHCPKQCWKG